ncbi:hypothetical protein BHE74_00058937 [Ensete ventricosum]|nr:hypothetical protein BHE74_00058937 [Ensete ventricosum]
MAWGWCRLKSYSTHAPTELGTEQLPLVPCARFKISGVGSYDKGWRSHSFIVYESEDWASRWYALALFPLLCWCCRRYPCAGDGCPFPSATTLPRGSNPCGRHRRSCWRPPLQAGRRRPCPRAAVAPAGGCPMRAAAPPPCCLRYENAIRMEIVYPCIPDPNGEDKGGQASSSLAVSTRWISTAKLLQSDLTTLAQREGVE